MEDGKGVVGTPLTEWTEGVRAASLAPPQSSVPITPQIPDHVLIGQIGSGSYGDVWLARNVMGVLRAVKIVWRKTFWHSHPYEREFKGIRRFEPISRSHPGLVQILHVGRNDQHGYFYYVMELADPVGAPAKVSVAASEFADRTGELSLLPSGKMGGSDLSAYVPRTLAVEVSTFGRLPIKACVDIGLRLTSALSCLHEHKLVHRDIKPANLIIVNGVPKLADIGLVAEFAEAHSYVGTEGFIPPEGPGTVQADLYSLGKALYELSTGKDRHAFPQLPADLAEQSEADQLVELNAVLLKACQPDPNRRYASAEAMRTDLELLDRGQSVRHSQAVAKRADLAKKMASPMSLIRRLFVASKAEVPREVPIKKAFTGNAEAYENFLLGKSALNKSDGPGIERAIDCFQKAIALDPRFAAAHAGLARAYLSMEKMIATGQGWGGRAARAVSTALALDPDLAEAHMTRGELFYTPMSQWDYENAIKHQLRALELKPGPVTPHELLAFVCYHCGLLDEGRHELEQVLDIDSGNNLARSYMGQILVYLGKYDQALPFFIDLPKDSWLRGWEASLCLFYLKQEKEATALVATCLERNPGEPAMVSIQAMLAANRGDERKALEKINLAHKRTGLVHSHHVDYQVASAYALLRRPAEALHWLNRAANDGFPCFPFFQSDPNLSTLHSDPEFVSFLRDQQRSWQVRAETIRSLLRRIA